jgi:hypothetical protein
MADIPWWGQGSLAASRSPWSGGATTTASTAAAPPGYLSGGVTNYDPAYGGKPLVPNPASTSAAAVGANLNNLGSIYQLTSGATQNVQQNLLNEYGAAGVNVPAINAQSASNITSLQHGILPPDVVNQMLQQAAERGVSTGAPGSPNANAAYLAAIGKTSLDLETMGEQEASQLFSRTPVAPGVRPESMFISPDAVQQAAMAASLYGSAPVPAAAAAAARQAAGAAGGSGPYASPFPTIRGGTPPGTDALGFSTAPLPGEGGSMGGPDVTLGANVVDTGDPYANWNRLASTWAMSPATAPAADTGAYDTGFEDIDEG